MGTTVIAVLVAFMLGVGFGIMALGVLNASRWDEKEGKEDKE